MPDTVWGTCLLSGATVAIALIVSLRPRHTASPGLSFQTGLLADPGQATTLAMHRPCQALVLSVPKQVALALQDSRQLRCRKC